MKKFKNNFVITGTPALLKTFEEEAKLIGWNSEEPWNSQNPSDDFCKYTKFIHEVNKFEHHTHDCHLSVYTLPQDWSKALELASEVEEEVPEYVKCTKSGIFNTLDDVVEGSIWKTDSKGYPDGDYRIVWSDGSGQIIGEYNKKYFIPATKSEFDAQEKRLKEEELLEEAYRRFPIGTKFKSTYSDKGRTIEIKPFGDNKDVTFTIGYYSWDNYKPSVRCENGINGGGCSNPQLYIEGKGWCEIVKDEFKVGEWVVVKELIGFIEDLSNYTAVYLKLGNIYKVKSIPWEYEEGEFGIELEEEETQNITFPIKSFRKATPEEIQAASIKPIKIAGYEAEFSNGAYGDENVVVSFGCKKNISQSDVYAIEGVMELSKRLGLDIQCNDGILTINDDVVSEDTISELIEKLD